MRDRPAFPTPEFNDEKPIGCEPGMTFRQYVAAEIVGCFLPELALPTAEQYLDRAARLAVKAADALIAALEAP